METHWLRAWRVATIVVALVALGAACGGGATEASSAPTPSPVANDDPNRVVTSAESAGSEPDLGAPCDPLVECGDGFFCDGPAGCDVQWTCQPMRACTRDLVSYCGCNGETFQASGNCPGVGYASRGPCPEEPSPGS